LKFIPYGHQEIDKDDVQTVLEVLQSDWLTQGPVIDIFEKTVADYCGAKYTVADYEEAISIPIYHGLTNEEQDYVIAALKKVLS